MGKITGYIEKWRAGKSYWCHVVINGRISDLSKYKTRQGRNKKVRKLIEKYPSHKIRVKQ